VVGARQHVHQTGRQPRESSKQQRRYR
jgi:hypothetical protein